MLAVPFLCGTLSAQKQIDNVVSVDLQNIIPIENGEKIKGYSVFYKADKIKRGDYSYRLAILDENAEQVAEEKITASKDFFLLEAKYNGELLCFKFFDYIKRKKYT